jgi:hypothetical protein
MINELGRIWKEVVMTCVMVFDLVFGYLKKDFQLQKSYSVEWQDSFD